MLVSSDARLTRGNLFQRSVPCGVDQSPVFDIRYSCIVPPFDGPIPDNWRLLSLVVPVMAAALPSTVNIRRQVIIDSQENDVLHPEHVEHGSCAIHSSMTIFFDMSSNTAFFKLQSPVVLLVQSSQTDHYDTVRSNVHLCIRPEHVTTLVHDRPKFPERLAPLYNKIAGQETLCLHFKLSKRAEWIVLSFETLIPKTQDDARLLEAFQRLSKV